MDYGIEFKLAHLLSEAQMTQKELAKQTGIRESTISDLVRGTRTVLNYSYLTKISEALELKSINEIIDFKK